ncbi:MAG: hypothetical protein OEM52_15005, partial [bacterium]|nr:hypothetical protein [bacterium]
MLRQKIKWMLLILGAVFCITTASAIQRITGTIMLPTGIAEEYYLTLHDDYSPLFPPPILIGCHSYGSNYTEFSGTVFEEKADTLGWMTLAISGVPSTERGFVHWWSKRVQQQLDIVLDSIMSRYPFDIDNMYIIGGSMGGAAGMQYNNNHLDPTGYMVRATAGGSGIIDLARRKREQGSNVSMMWEFGGVVDSVSDYVNFEYKRNSGVVFWDTTNSLHYNMMWMPLYQSSGVLEPHYIHDTDLVDLFGAQMRSYRVDSTTGASHGWVNLHPDTTMNWFLNQPALNRHPTLQNIAADEPRRCYDIEFLSLYSDTNMARAII